MQRMTAFTCLAATLMISMAGARAQAPAVQAKVPFDFHISNLVFPAGAYQVSHASDHSILIRSLDGRFHALASTYAADGRPRGVGMLVFRKYGTQYFLREVLCNAVHINVAIPASRREKQASVEEAGIGSSETLAAIGAGAK